MQNVWSSLNSLRHRRDRCNLAGHHVIGHGVNQLAHTLRDRLVVLVERGSNVAVPQMGLYVLRVSVALGIRGKGAPPNGLEIPRDLAAEYVERADINSIPTRAIEAAISDHEWAGVAAPTRTVRSNKFHLIPALQYVDEIVSDDKFLHRLHPWPRRQDTSEQNSYTSTSF